MKRALKYLATAVTLVLLAAAVLIAHTEHEPVVTSTVKPDPQRGEYLARAGNCYGCHTRPGGAAYAGGRALPTPFGTFLTPNITPDRTNGIGAWSQDDFWRALHHGKGRDGRLLYPAFPYTEYTRVTREDADHLFAYLQTLPPVAEARFADYLRFPFNQRTLLYAWRALYFSPGAYENDRQHDAEWNRGAYLVQGLGHCRACHGRRNLLGATGGASLGGGVVAGRSWYAPSLTASDEVSAAEWPVETLAQHLSTGVSAQGAVSGPMAEVVSQSLQYLTAADVRAIAVYLRAMPRDTSTGREAEPPPEPRLTAGRKLYDAQCKDCHGEDGEGMPGAYPPLKGNRSVTLPDPLNAIRSVQDGGYAPATRGNPRPYGMPPFAQSLTSAEIADVLTYVRASWGNRAGAVSARQVDSSTERE